MSKFCSQIVLTAALVGILTTSGIAGYGFDPLARIHGAPVSTAVVSDDVVTVAVTVTGRVESGQRWAG